MSNIYDSIKEGYQRWSNMTPDEKKLEYEAALANDKEIPRNSDGTACKGYLSPFFPEDSNKTFEDFIILENDFWKQQIRFWEKYYQGNAGEEQHCPKI